MQAQGLCMFSYAGGQSMTSHKYRVGRIVMLTVSEYGNVHPP